MACCRSLKLRTVLMSLSSPSIHGLSLIVIACHAAAPSLSDLGQRARSCPFNNPRDTVALPIAVRHMSLNSALVIVMVHPLNIRLTRLSNHSLNVTGSRLISINNFQRSHRPEGALGLLRCCKAMKRRMLALVLNLIMGSILGLCLEDYAIYMECTDSIASI